jgi:hypothetical protein
LRALLDDARLTPNQRASVAMQVYGMTDARAIDRMEVYGTYVSDPVEFGSTFVMLGGRSPNCEMFLNGRWYPVVVNVEFLEDKDKLTRGVALRTQLSLCESSYHITHFVYPSLFLDQGGMPQERTVVEVLEHFGFRGVEASPADFNLKLVRAERAAREHGKVVLVNGLVLVRTQYAWISPLESRALGTPEQPRRAVIEPDIVEEHRQYYSPYGRTEEGVSRLPFLRIFSLDTTTYAYADVDDVAPYAFDTLAMGRLHLPAEMLDVLTKVFRDPLEGLFGDLIRGKHGGAVILASGSPGVGKTLTAEVYAEQTERPLYVLELGELGTNPSQVEENLQRVFTRVARWNAVLQFDECEIFLSHRDDDLKRSAIVGIFLRLLDYYRGILFLTTNRPEALDYAVRSRVMLKPAYPDLDGAARAVIWRTMLDVSGLRMRDGTVLECSPLFGLPEMGDPSGN